MKKLIASFVLLSIISIGVPKIADAAEGPCYVHNMCGHYVVICDAYDYVVWDEIYCGISEE